MLVSSCPHLLRYPIKDVVASLVLAHFLVSTLYLVRTLHLFARMNIAAHAPQPYNFHIFLLNASLSQTSSRGYGYNLVYVISKNIFYLKLTKECGGKVKPRYKKCHPTAPSASLLRRLIIKFEEAHSIRQMASSNPNLPAG